ncbi:MAG: hypothetical protein PHF29_08445 [Candidatus Riflebacteria bacterium]|nr:hypothetical protein [Candidatus Riflebacteria bacterium]
MKIWELIKKLLGKKEEPELDRVTRQVVIENGKVKEVVYHNLYGSYYKIGDVVSDEVKNKLTEMFK